MAMSLLPSVTSKKQYRCYIESAFTLANIFQFITLVTNLPANISLVKVNIRNNKKSCEICSKLTLKHQNNVTDVVLVFLLLTLKIFHTFF